MTNTQIIYNAALAYGFTADQLNDLLTAYNGALPFHTFSEWSRMGYQVKAGEHALFCADLWKYTDKPSKATREAAAQATDSSDNEPQATGHYYKKLSDLFAANQVEKATPAPSLSTLQDKFQNIPGLTLTIKGAKTARPVVWLSGDTDPHADAIRAAGGHWSSKKGAWFFKPAA